MTQRNAQVICALMLLVGGFVALHKRPTVAGAASQQSQPEDKPVEQTYKNIQVLKGLPSSQILPVMHFMRTSLGVRCDYCHIAENGKYWMDDKPTKQTARKMLQMVADINKANFGGQPVVTCNTCHRGSTKPLSVPAIGQGAFTDTTRAEADAKAPEPLPTADKIFNRYVQAIGGPAAVEKIRTRFTKVTLLRPKLINSGTPKATMLNRGESLTIETFQKAPDKYLTIITTPEDVVYQGYNGVRGWIKTRAGQREMNSAEITRSKRNANLYRDLQLKEQYTQMKVIARDSIGGSEVYVVEARSLGNKTERLFFDVKRGFLLRRTVLNEIRLGLDPEQTDYEDYRQVDSVWVPFTVRTSYLDDNHLGTTRTITVLKHNLQVADEKFNGVTPPK